MPIKIPKSLQRRKSSGNALEELPNPPEPSFRVFERPEGIKSFDGGNTRRMSNGRPLSAGHFDKDILFVDGRPNLNPSNRGSGGTNNSASSGGHNDNSSSSARFSSTSTLPSSTDLPLDESTYTSSRNHHDIPAPPIPETHHSALKAAGRAFSFGRKKAELPSLPPAAARSSVEHAQPDGYTTFGRQRALTESSYASESTATPPKLLDGGLLDLDDGFGNMFDTFGRRQSTVLEQPPVLGGTNTESPENMSPAGSRMLTKSYFGDRQFTPSPIQIDRSPRMQDSPHSWASEDSQDGLMNTSRQRAADALAYYNRDTADSSEPAPSQALSKSKTTPLPEPTSPHGRRRQQRPPSMAGGALRRSSGYDSQKSLSRNSDQMQDTDAKLVMDSLRASQRLNHRSQSSDPYEDETYNPKASLIPKSSYPSSPYPTSNPRIIATPESKQYSPGSMFDSSDQDFSATPWRKESSEITPRAKHIQVAPQEERSMFDASPPPSARSAPIPSLPERKLIPRPDTQNKVMTPAQFKKYRDEQEARREQYFHKDESEEEGDDYEDDDEMERNKQLARERRKQEAHLSVYRQQMMKVTGEQPSDLPNVMPGAPNLAKRSTTPTFTFDKPTDAGKSSDDEDEDVPLGVLAAHGFPSKTRPPTAASSNIKFKSESYPPPPGSVAGASSAGGRPLPPFAKNLPQDPYYGAGIVNPSNREPLAFSQGGGASVAGSPRPAGGLVGVIAGEERARAARRGSPNSQGNYGSPLPQGMMQSGTPPGMSPMMSPGEQATVQMSEQMTQMMQMQMQWMQQMQQMMAGGGVQAMPPAPQMPSMMAAQQQQQMMMNAGMLAPPGQQQRPISAPNPPSGVPPAQQRAMSMMNPTSAPAWQPQGGGRMSHAPSMMSGALHGLAPGYASSLAPSERSNVGLPGRYRPVSIAPADEHGPRATSRASTFTSGTLQPTSGNSNIRTSTSGERQSKLSVRPVIQAQSRNAGSDDDDEEGWAEMKQKREQKKSNWRLKKQKDDNSALDLYDYPEGT